MCNLRRHCKGNRNLEPLDGFGQVLIDKGRLCNVGAIGTSEYHPEIRRFAIDNAIFLFSGLEPLGLKTFSVKIFYHLSRSVSEMTGKTTEQWTHNIMSILTIRAVGNKARSRAALHCRCWSYSRVDDASGNDERVEINFRSHGRRVTREYIQRARISTSKEKDLGLKQGTLCPQLGWLGSI